MRKPPAYDADPLLIASALRRGHDMVADWAAALPAGREVVAYCVHGHEVSQGVARTLTERGVRAGYLEGGIETWADAPVMTAQVFVERAREGAEEAVESACEEIAALVAAALPSLQRRGGGLRAVEARRLPGTGVLRVHLDNQQCRRKEKSRGRSGKVERNVERSCDVIGD